VDRGACALAEARSVSQALRLLLGRRHPLLTAVVVPRPIGWISTISESGVRNVAPYSYFNLMGSDPPYVAFGSTGIKDSLRNLCEVPEFVANIVTMHLLERMNFTSGDFPHEENEFDWACLTPAPSAKVRPFRVAEASGCQLKPCPMLTRSRSSQSGLVAR
jgi:flavin reductase (DIM6/NTAB) family NADH-FMN oxidoreductase RutF